MASDESLKQKKCQVAITYFKFSDSRPRLQQLKSLPEHQFEIPQKDGIAEHSEQANYGHGVNTHG